MLVVLFFCMTGKNLVTILLFLGGLIRDIVVGVLFVEIFIIEQGIFTIVPDIIQVWIDEESVINVRISHG